MQTVGSEVGSAGESGWRNVGEVERWASLALGTTMVVYGASRPLKTGAWMAALAMPLLHRGSTGHCYVYSALDVTTVNGDTRDALSGDRGVHVREAVRLEKPVEEVYRFWRKLENLPRFMAHVKDVTDLGGGRSHWTVEGPGAFAWSGMRK